MTRTARRAAGGWRLRALAWLSLSLAACDSATEPRPPAVDLDALFQPPTAEEVTAVRADWAGRHPEGRAVLTEAELTLAWAGDSATARIVSHEVDGLRHYGAIVTPRGAAEGSLPLLVYAHGGDQGVSLEEVQLAAALLGELASAFVVVVPSFRSESLSFGDSAWTSGGTPSPWDRDVDDALALLDVAVQEAPAGDPDRRAVLGLSRGAAVGMLMAIRDARIDRVVEFFGPTDFFGPYVREITEAALEGEVRDLPGFEHLNTTVLQPLARGEMTLEAVRLELARRSPVLFAEDLPPLQLHHGTADPVVDVSQAERLIATMEALGGAARGFEGWLYPGGGHNPFTLSGSGSRTLAFLAQQLE